MNQRYILKSETPLHAIKCECGKWYQILVRTYYDRYTPLNSEGEHGTVETSVRTSCYCAEERDPYRDPQPAMVDLRKVSNFPKVG